MSDGSSPHVTIENFVRAETDFQMRGYIDKVGCFGRMVHSRAPYDVRNQVTVRGNRDTLYWFGVFDLASPLTVNLPDPGDRYQSLMTVSQDHSIEVSYSPAEVTLTVESVGTRYVMLVVRTFATDSSKMLPPRCHFHLGRDLAPLESLRGHSPIEASRASRANLVQAQPLHT